MRRAMLLCVVLVLTACSDTTIRSTPDEPGETTVSPAAKEAKVGDTIQLRGTDEGLVIDATVVKLVDPATPQEGFEPEPGIRLVALQVRLNNSGTIVYDDSPSNGAVLIDSQGQSFDEYGAYIKEGPGLANAKISPGDSRLGFLVWQVPEASQLATFQFTLDSGFAPETGEWSLT